MHVHGHAWRAQEYITELLREPALPPDAPTVPPHACRERLVEWRSTPAHKKPPPAHLMPMNFSSDSFLEARSLGHADAKGCKQATNFYGRVLRTRERLHVPPLQHALSAANATLWLLGDSIMSHTAMVAACTGSRASPDVAAGKSANRWHFVPKWRRSFYGGEKWAWRRQGGHGIEHVTTSCSDFGGRVCYVAAGTLRGRAPPTVFSALTRLFALDVIAPEDIIVVNEGAWFYAQDSNSSDAVPPLAHKVTEHVGELLAVLANRTALAHRSNATMPRIIWRETFAQHFATHDGLYLNPKTASTPATCVAVAKKPRVIADLADTLRASSDFLGFLPTWRLTQTLEDEHTDCTHYCLDSGVHDAVLDAVAFELSVRVRR